ncbi:MAG: RnfABCDGE type electron transport complex subunit D [Lentisphaerae bacterium]|nr:RnfABCDGE type electron transport complex subunit D [Lentisphaerota bacterium]
MKPLLEKARRNRFLKPMEPVFDALEAAVFGSDATTAGGPHCVDGLDIKRYMTVVIAGLTPAVLAAVWAFGVRSLAMIVVSYLFGGLVEVGFAMARKKHIHEGFLVTGLIFPLTLPPTVPLWVVAVGVVVGTLFGKEMFGGTGRNIFNPALVGRLFVTIAFPSIMSTAWQIPGSDAITTATPLGMYKTSQAVTALTDLLVGRATGSMGEVFRVGLIAGGLFVIWTRVSEWRIPLSYLGSVAILSAAGHRFAPARVAPPLFQLFAGGLMLGAFFMATDPVTSPFTKAGKWVFGTMCGLLTVLIRGFSGYVEGVMFSIVIMNGLAPLIDHIVLKATFRPRPRAKAGAPAPAPAHCGSCACGRDGGRGGER